jgi:hypothetical protein
MPKALDFMQEVDSAIAGCESIQRAQNGYAVNHSSLRKIVSSKIAPEVILLGVRQQLIE